MPKLPTIEQLRKQIEEADALIIETLAKRQALSRQIGQLKSNDRKEIKDSSREEQLFAFYEELSEEYHLENTFIKEIFALIIAHSKTIQKI